MALRVAYLVNQYPKVSHSFIRREILALERQGVSVQRIAVRGWDEALVDEADLRERELTRYVLRGGLWPLVAPTLRALRDHPRGFLQAMLLACRMGWRGDRPLPFHLVYLAQACFILSWLRESGATHLHAHFGTNPAEVAMLVHALGGPPFSFTVHGPEEFDRPIALGLGEKLRRCAFAVAVSSYGRSQLYRWVASAHWPKIRVVHCGLDREFHAVPVAPVPAAPRLVCVGRLCEQKGQLLLLQAAQRLRQRGVDFELVLAGDGEMRPEVESLIQAAGLQAQVRITGWIAAAQVRDEILAARAMVLPSFAEGLPVALMEAMALRRPVVTTHIAGIPELVQPPENGWLVPAGDVDALAAAMQDCLAADAGTLARMGEAARQRVLERHDVDAQVAQLAALFGQPGPHPASQPAMAA
ncbi:MAG TPA: glycosyltransferase [Albitalea sp.]|uniref:glycosyltransferase n=1 Tax=Piscinibacter sp. TaxID=1903157 RepID=UPI002ED3B7F1